MTTELWPHQQRAVEQMSASNSILLDMEMATGKSRVIVEYVARHRCKQVLVICPRSVIPVWRKQFWLHHPRPTEAAVFELTDHAVKGKAAKLEMWLRLCAKEGAKPTSVVVVNYESAWREPLKSLLISTMWDLVVCDESHKIKTHNSQVSKFAAQLAPSAAMRACLSGTPMPQGPLDIWSQCRFLDQDIFGPSFIRFKLRYTQAATQVNPQWPVEWQAKLCRLPGPQHGAACALIQDKDLASYFAGSIRDLIAGWLQDGNKDSRCPLSENQWGAAVKLTKYSHHKIVRYRFMDEFKQRLSRVIFQARASEVLSLPQTRQVDWPVALSASEARAYSQMQADFAAWVADEVEVTAANALVKLLRLQQITSGFLPVPSAAHAQGLKPTKLGDSSKMEALVEILDGLAPDEPVVVFCRFLHDIESVKEACLKTRRTFSEMTGALDELAKWQAGETTVLAAQISKGSLGVEMIRARYALFYSVGFNVAEYLQALARLNRPGQEREVTYLHLVARETIDEKVYAALAAKRDVVDSILEDIRQAKKKQEIVA